MQTKNKYNSIKFKYLMDDQKVIFQMVGVWGNLILYGNFVLLIRQTYEPKQHQHTLQTPTHTHTHTRNTTATIIILYVNSSSVTVTFAVTVTSQSQVVIY